MYNKSDIINVYMNKILFKLFLTALLLSYINIFLFLNGPYFSYSNFNALQLMRDNWYLHYFEFLFLPLICLFAAIKMFKNLSTNMWFSQNMIISDTKLVIAKILYVAIAVNFLIVFLLYLNHYSKILSIL